MIGVSNTILIGKIIDVLGILSAGIWTRGELMPLPGRPFSSGFIM